MAQRRRIMTLQSGRQIEHQGRYERTINSMKKIHGHAEEEWNKMQKNEWKRKRELKNGRY